ncbi:HAD family hydrolase [Streptomyces sp. WAC 04229]|uniref:HAD family hydrolase n=1 Tax=Streptomyces sp. WAC 04229 TaxID=2203206 RepID=UPI000F748110|nr:HAD family hydrolase [Streptomyces sp. WAC 04229]RSN51673.1 HAD family hydrolase [Streptomyces sp. WAC 04229]
MDRAAVFDVDGTLVDTNHLHVVSWWEAFRQAGHEVPMHALHRAVGMPSSDLVGHVLGEDRDRDRDAELSAAHKALYGQYFDRLPALPDAGKLLRRLAGDGWTVVLATSAGGPELGALRRAIDADDAIAATASADDVEAGKPSPEPVEHALELAGVPAERAVFVGDTVWDMRAGSRAGVRCVAVLCGGLPRADLEEAGADAVYGDPADLLASLERSPLARGAVP